MTTLLHLSTEQRAQAKAKAVAQLKSELGDAPRRQDYANAHASKYPDWAINLVARLAGVLLLVVFVPSAVRLYTIGSGTFNQSIESSFWSSIAGFCTIATAEIGVILFTLSFATLAYNALLRALVCLGIALMMLIAIIGNYEQALWQAEHQTVFAWLEALSPPILTLITSYILKEVLLHRVEQNHACNTAYSKALAEYDQRHSDLTLHPQFSQTYASHLKEAFRAHNLQGRGREERRAILDSLDLSQWARLIAGEMAQDNWFNGALNVQEVHSVQAVQLPTQQFITPVSSPSFGFGSLSAMNRSEQIAPIEPTEPTEPTPNFSPQVIARARQVVSEYPDILDMNGQHDLIAGVCGISKGGSTGLVLQAIKAGVYEQD